MREDGVAAAVVVAEDLAEEAPDGGHRAEDAVAEEDAVLIEPLKDTGLAQRFGKGQAPVARKAGAGLLESGHRILKCLGGEARRTRCGPAGAVQDAAGQSPLGGASEDRLAPSFYARFAYASAIRPTIRRR
jgi:hypothetical protein